MRRRHNQHNTDKPVAVVYLDVYLSDDGEHQLNYDADDDDDDAGERKKPRKPHTAADGVVEGTNFK